MNVSSIFNFLYKSILKYSINYLNIY